MLKINEQYEWTNWEESKPDLEAAGLLDRAALEKELEKWRRNPKYSFKNAEFCFSQIVAYHIHDQIKQRYPGYRETPRIHPARDRSRQCIVYLGAWHDHFETPPWEKTNRYCAAPDWLSALYYDEADQHLTLKCPVKEGTFFYNPASKKTYVVFETNTIGAAEAADLEDANDIFGAEGTYSHLCYPRTEEERAGAQREFERQQGTIGSVNIFQDDMYTPVILLPDQGEHFAFDDKTYALFPYSQRHSGFHSSLWFIARGISEQQRQAALRQATTVLQEHYPEVRIIPWADFEELLAHRIS